MLFPPLKGSRLMQHFDDFMTRGDAYVDEIIQDAHDNPRIRVGMLVQVLDDEWAKTPTDEGMVVAMEWSDYFLQHMCTVVTAHEVIEIVAGRLERLILDPSQVRQLLEVV